MDKGQYDVLIIGGGISGTALLYELAKFTDLSRIGLVEKYDRLADVNSHGRNNSQTLHCGDIETNYTIDKAIQVKQTASMVLNYAEKQSNRDRLIYKYSKMVLGVGRHECESLRDRYEIFKNYFPNMQVLESSDIAAIEPTVVDGRKDEIVALGVLDEYTAVNYGALANSFVEQAKTVTDKTIDVLLETQVDDIVKNDSGYIVKTPKGELKAKFVVVSAGGHSLLFAHRMGYCLEYSCLPMAGSFYYTPSMLNGKVYTVQNEKLPFAAIHGDPDVLVPDKTRFGPTALMLPMLERYNMKTIFDFLQVVKFDMNVAHVLWDLLKVSDIRNYMFKNILFEIPMLRTNLFLKDARKIIPEMQLSDLSFANKIGGIRPVMIDKINRKLHLGEAKINTGEGVIFNMTPSPGATSCLGNAEGDLKIIVEHLKCQYKEKELNETLKND